MPIIVIFVVPAAFLFGGFYWIARQPVATRIGWCMLTLFPLTWPGGYLLLFPFGLGVWLFGYALAILVAFFGPRRVDLFGACVVAAAIAGGAGFFGWKNHQWSAWLAARERYPVENLSHRFGSASIPPGYRNSAHEFFAFSEETRFDEFANRVEASEEPARRRGYREDDVNLRTTALARLHSVQFDEFINLDGFGAMRMDPAGRNPLPYVDLPKQRSSPQPSKQPLADDSTPDASGATNAPAPTNAELSRTNRLQIAGFANRPGWGYVKDRTAVAGFIAHGMERVYADSAEQNASARWKVNRIELVSLLKFAEPGVYVSDNLPAMDELKNAKTRPLDDFERDALAKIKAGAEIETRQQPTSIRMLGSIRAVTQCAKCHACKPGDLLGAFSYRLVPGGSTP